MAATGQTSLDPANLPNSFPLDDSSPADTHPPSELNLSDYDWSVSSRGPPDEDDLESVESQWFPPSVHLDRRLQGSVCLTPSTCTSWGPPDYDLEYSPISNVARLPSPDVALRMLDDAPATPSTCTSWGPPSYPTSPTGIESNSRPLSIDLGHRSVFSRPRTPSTATSWGPPDSYPPSPSTPYYVRSPDIAERGFDLEFREDLPRNRPWRFVWPYQGARLSRASSHADVSSSEQVLPLSTSTGEPWRMIWPYLDIHGSGSVREEMHGSPSQHDGQPWQLVWPYTEIGAGADQQRVGASGPFSTTISASQSQPGMASEPWTLVWPYTAREDVQHPPQKTHLKAELPEGATQYPYFVVCESLVSNSHRLPYTEHFLDPPVYPHFELYPEKAATVALHIPRPVVVSLGNSVSVNYPHFDLYPVVSTFERSDAVAPIPLTGCPSSQTISDSISVLLPASYPSLSICEWPNF